MLPRLISMSLFGTKGLYLTGAIINARIAPEFYPGWQLRMYVAADVPADVIDKLVSLGVDIIPRECSEGRSGTFWRHLAAADAAYEYVIFRDVDSRLNSREVAAVNAWIASGLDFHVMHDHFAHRRAILSGMWGCKGGSVPDMEYLINTYKPQRPLKRGEEERLIEKYVWPRMIGRVMHHRGAGRVFKQVPSTPFPPHAKTKNAPYVGSIIGVNNWKKQLSL